MAAKRKAQAKAAPNKPETTKKKAKGKPGPQSTFSEEIAETIMEGLMNGESMVEICRKPGMPNRMTVIRWMDKYPEFAAGIARAREEQGEYMDHLILDEARNCTPENAQAARVRIAAYQWRAAKLKPKSFGDNSSLTVDQTVRTAPLTDEQLEEELRKSPAMRAGFEKLLKKTAQQ